MGYGCSGSGAISLGGLVLKAAVFVLASYAFSYIFWATKKQMDTPSKKKK